MLIFLVIIGVIMLGIFTYFLLPTQECGHSTTAYPASSTIDCTCVGFDATPESMGGGPIYCKGFCLKDTRKKPAYVIEQEKKDMVGQLKYDAFGSKLLFSISEISMKSNEEKSILYALKNIKNEFVELTVTFFCVKSSEGTDCSNLNFQKKITLNPEEVKVDSIDIKFKNEVLTPQTYLWKINVTDDHNEQYDSKIFFIKIE